MARSIAVDAARAAVWIWLFIHLVLLILSGVWVTAATLLTIPAVVAAVVLVDQRVSRETVILGNLGVSVALAPISGGLASLLLELSALLIST